MARLFNESRKAPFSGAVSTPHHAPSGEPSVALVAQKTRCGQGGRGRAAPSPGLPYQHQAGRAARRNPAQAVPDRRLYRPRPAYSRGTRTPYAPGAPAQSRTVTRFAVPVQQEQGAARRNPDMPVPARQPYRARRAYQRHSRTPYAPGGSDAVRTVARFAVPTPGGQGGA
jgi:hypothetical protein